MADSLQIIRDVLSGALRARQIWLDSFYYSANWSLGASEINAPQQIHIDADADFLIVYGMLEAYSAPGTVVADPDYTISIMDTGSGRNFQSLPVHVRNLFGSAKDPFNWPEPKLVSAASTLNLQLTNRTATAATVQVTFAGVKVFYFSGFSRAQLGSPFGG